MPNPKMKILIVDDLATTRRIIKNMLRSLGFNNTSESDGKTARDMLKRGDFEFVITDFHLNIPGFTGIDLVKYIRRDDELKHLPVMIVFADAKRERVLEAAQAGVNSYIVKPFTADTLKEKLSKLFARL